VLIAKLFRLPVFVGCLGSDINILARRGFRRHIVAWTLRSSDRVLSVSSALKKATLAMGVDAAKSVVISNGTDRDRFRQISQRDARQKLNAETPNRVIVTVSRLSHEKGIDVLINAFAQIEDSALELWIVGDGVQKPHLDRLVRSHRLQPRVRFLGARPHREIPLWMSAGDLFALPSRAEGHPNAVVEALACGRPVVATRVGGVPETVYSAEMGLLVEPDDVEGLASGIKEALRRHWEPARIAKLGGSRTWDDVAREIMQEIQPVVQVLTDVGVGRT
jgi:glycosyltransferase involved in cell wall biosynthesis